jgi:hypothetical protein
MASEIRVNQIQNRSGLSTVTFSDTGVVISGITTISDLRISGTTIVAAGTTSAPSISPTGDSNTGIFFPSADTIAFAEGGSEALRVTSSGDIGIGTATPSNYFSYDLVVKSRQNTGGITIAANSTSDTNYLMFADGTSGNAAYRGYINYAHSDDSLNIASAGSVRATLTSTGNLQIANGNLVFSTAGTGIDFSATANSSGTMTSELLNDYEEGTFTPTITAGITSPTYNSGNTRGTYRKIGKVVFFTLRITLTAGTTTGSGLRVGGLPFTSAAGIEYRILFHGQFQSGASGASVTAINYNATAYMDISNSGSGAIISGTTATNTLDLQITGTYPTA